MFTSQLSTCWVWSLTCGESSWVWTIISSRIRQVRPNQVASVILRSRVQISVELALLKKKLLSNQSTKDVKEHDPNQLTLTRISVWKCFFRPFSFFKHGTTTKLKVTIALTGFPDLKSRCLQMIQSKRLLAVSISTWQAKQELLSALVCACCKSGRFARFHVHSSKMYLSPEIFDQHIFDQVLRNNNEMSRP